LKPLLLDQTFIAGLGNIYVDEALFDAALHPARISSSLSRTEIVRLHRSIRKVLRCGIRNGGTTLGYGQTGFSSIHGNPGRNRKHLMVFRREGSSCPRCGENIERTVIGQRGTHLCPFCQPSPS